MREKERKGGKETFWFRVYILYVVHYNLCIRAKFQASSSFSYLSRYTSRGMPYIISITQWLLCILHVAFIVCIPAITVFCFMLHIYIWSQRTICRSNGIQFQPSSSLSYLLCYYSYPPTHQVESQMSLNAIAIIKYRTTRRLHGY